MDPALNPFNPGAGEGIIYAPEYGAIQFTVPGTADFIARQTGD